MVTAQEYDKAKPARQRELQDLLSARNQHMNSFVAAKQREQEEKKDEDCL
jgi:hypothetical protein